MKGAWKKVSGSATATDSSKGDRRGSASKDFPPLSSAGIGGDSAGVSDANSNSNALFSKLRQTVATAQLAAHNLHLAAVSPSAAFEKRKVTIWPEWNDNEVNVEKWDASCAPKGKDDKKGKSPTASAYFEDPDGKLDLPASLRVDHWKRPHDFMDDDRPPVVVDVDHMGDNFDLVTNNTHLINSEFLRYFISQVMILWEQCLETNDKGAGPDQSLPDDSFSLHTWHPWEHIYSLNKVVKNHVPLYNPYGKYLVRIYWMGCWRKIQVDDLLPFDEHDQLLLPVTTQTYELWPMLLAKALIKVASLDYSGGNQCQEFGDMLILHNLTGWLPEAIPLNTPPSYSASQVLDLYYSLLKTHSVRMYEEKNLRHSHLSETWELLKTLLPEWLMPEVPEPGKQEETTEDPSCQLPLTETPSKEVQDPNLLPSPTATHMKEARPACNHDKAKEEKSKENLREKHKDKERGGRGGDDKKKEKEKEKDKDKKGEKAALVEEPPVIPEKPEVMIFATFGGFGRNIKISQLARMADASERLRQNGLSHQYPHLVCITQTRSCSMELPPPPEVVPAWKQIRPRKKKEQPTDEPKAEEEPPKDIQCLEISSPFVNFVNPVPIPTTTTRAITYLERGNLRKIMNTGSIMETEEFVPEQEALPEIQPPAEIEDMPVVQETLELEQPEDTEEVKGKKAGQQKPKSARRDKNSDCSETQSLLGKGFKAERNNPKGKGPKKAESRTARKEEAEDKKGKDKEEAQPEVVADEGGEAESAAIQTEEPTPALTKPSTQWIDFDQFCICFRTLIIFHKPATYLCNQRYSDLKNITPTTPAPPTKGDKKQAISVSGVQGLYQSQVIFFVDSLKPTEVVVAFSVLPRWFDPVVPPASEEKKAGVGGKGKEKGDKDMDKETNPMNSFSNVQETAGNPTSPWGEPSALTPIVSPGTLVAEPYSWKSLVKGQPILRLRTTGIRAAVITLPPGRHVLKFILKSPLAHHIHMCCTVPVVFGDEETIMPYLVHESCRFKDSSAQLMTALGKCVAAFSDSQQEAEAMEEMNHLLCPPAAAKKISHRKHNQNFNEVLYSTLRRALREAATPDMALAWRAFRQDVSTPNILGLPLGPRPDSSTGEKETPVAASGRGSGKPGSKKQMDSKQSSEPEKTESVWMSKYLEPTVEEQVAAVKILRTWRGFWVRRVKKTAIPGTEENLKAHKNLTKSWAVLEANIEDSGLFLFRELFKRNADMMQYYPFYSDEWNRVTYADYRGVFTEQPPNTWFLIFREVFYVKEETLVMPRIYVPVPTCMLRVIDNDTGLQLPTVFQKVAPYVYKRNKKGYTFVAEARTLNQVLMCGAWRMRLIGSFSTLPAPRVPDTVNSTFLTKEIKDYYLPQPTDILFRYTVKVTEDQLVSLQVCTSKVDVYLRLCVLDQEEEVCSATGKGHVVIPAFIFQKDILAPPSPDDPTAAANASQLEVRMSSRTSTRVGSSKGQKVKKSSSMKSQEDKVSRDSHMSDPAVNEVLKEKIHKYIVQATVLKNSWQLSDEDRVFVSKLKEEEKNDLRVFWIAERKDSLSMDNGFQGGPAGAIERPHSPPKADKLTVSQKGKSKGKGSKEKELSSQVPPARVVSFPDKPSWILRVVLDSTAAEELEVKKDTERVDEIRAIKKAWEEADPGRAAKAFQSRLKYLSSRGIKQATGEKTATQDGPPSSSPSPSPLPDTPVKIDVPQEEEGHGTTAPGGKKSLQPIDLSAFYRGSEEKAVFVDEAYEHQLVEDRQRLIAEFKEQRQCVELWREKDRVDRNITKLRQLEDAQHLQVKVDEKREVVNIPREAFRQVYLEAERKRQEELAQQEALLKLEMEAKAEKTKKNAKGKKKK